ncbi:hypothetical protein LVY72_12905 [Arthrobacter sp. I2-34]|uniref:Uncharacterized protein n=1 Tax=Arthrobacter hankyongi TaxID=2904801 RepID=A0ABS9L7Z8_9MICC|nr:hypothetical protein [Arthrobacter hankyongi]MCG2622800.1 hypothetical protein [Arthrobacter hankyongi]
MSLLDKQNHLIRTYAIFDRRDWPATAMTGMQLLARDRLPLDAPRFRRVPRRHHAWRSR